MPIIAQATSPDLLNEDMIRDTLFRGLEGQFTGEKVLALIPDHTRTMPLPMIFRAVTSILHDAKQLDFMVALGTHPPLSDDSLLKLVGITKEERDTQYKHIGLLNHEWDNPETLVQIGTLEKAQIQTIAGDVWHSSMGDDTPIRINKLAREYDHILILGPTFPHEVAGFSGGAKYLFPGISGPEMINTTHWLGALITILNMIGIKDTPVRQMIHAAAACVTTPITLISMVVVGDGLAGLFIGDYLSAWEAAADLSSERHITWVDKPFKRVLSHAAPMYDELWTAGKAMYKLEPALADDSELIIYSPTLAKVSDVHGKYIYEIGYHVLDYFLKQWDKFKHVPKGVLAHSTHVRGVGTYENGVERGRIDVTLATGISEANSRTLALGYINPENINPQEWIGREDEGIVYIPKAGEMLYRLKK
jgi:lactate racemase